MLDCSAASSVLINILVTLTICFCLFQMSQSFFEQCRQHLGSSDLYQVFKVKKKADASESESELCSLNLLIEFFQMFLFERTHN